MQSRKAVQLEGMLRLLDALWGSPAGLTWDELEGLTRLTQRSVRRYLGAASDCDVSIERIRGDDGRVRVRLAGGPRLPLRIGVEESVALAQVRALAMAAVADLPWRASLEKLFSRLNAAVPEKLRALFGGEVESFGAAPHAGRVQVRRGVWEELERARREQRAVAMRYQSMRRTAERRFEPYVTYVAEGTAYVYGFDGRHKERRTFALDRVLSVQPLALHFTRPADVTPQGVVAELHRGYRERDRSEVVLVASGRAARLWEERPEMPDQSAERLGRGRVRVRFRAADTPALRAHILSFGAGVTVEAPEALRSAIAAEAGRMVRAYGPALRPAERALARRSAAKRGRA